jgi:hypothetical protein
MAKRLAKSSTLKYVCRIMVKILQKMFYRIESWSQSYKTHFGIIKSFFDRNNANFLLTNLSVEIYAKINTKKCLFDVKKLSVVNTFLIDLKKIISTMVIIF